MLFKKSALTKALTSWLNDRGRPGQDRKALSDYLPRDRASVVQTQAEANLVCAAIDKARSALGGSDDWAASHDLNCAMALMQQVGSAQARDALIQQGVPRLRALVRDHLAAPESKRDHTLFALKLIGMYRQPEDVQLFLDAARAPLEPDSFWWQPAFHGFDEQNPGTSALIAGLADPLPPGFILMVYLDKCNALAIAGHLDSHPFASPAGVAALEAWLSSTKQDETSYAISACVALPFIGAPDRERLLQLTDRHPAAAVQMEAAWVRARLEIAVGADRLIDFARDARYSAQAIGYLKELGLDARVPAEVRHPDFVALAEMCQWLAHPNEMGRPPDEIQLADARELHWPPTRDRRRLWTFRYRYDQGAGEAAEEGYGLVGSVTWAMFGTNTIELSLDDVYALHCAWELQHAEDPRAPEDVSVAAGREILAKYNPTFGQPSLSVH